MKWIDLLGLLGVVLMTGSTIVGTAAVLAHYYNQRVIFAMEQGYSLQSVPGEQGVHWVKDEEKLE